jgi:hypothetical protein
VVRSERRDIDQFSDRPCEIGRVGWVPELVVDDGEPIAFAHKPLHRPDEVSALRREHHRRPDDVAASG